MSYNKNNKLHIVSVVAVIRNQDGKYLVLKRSEHEIAFPGMYTFPGGKVEDNDTVEETLVKEAREEANLQLKPGKILLKDKSFVRPDEQTVKVFSYLCEVEDVSGLKISDDFTDYKWITLGDLKNIPHVGIDDELIQADKLHNNGFSMELLSTKSIRG